MVSKFKQFIDEIINGHDVSYDDEKPEIAPAPEQEQAKEQEPTQDPEPSSHLDADIEAQREQREALGPDAADIQEVADREQWEVNQPAPEAAPEHQPATGEITPGQDDVKHGLEQDASMDRSTQSDGLEQGGQDFEIEM